MAPASLHVCLRRPDRYWRPVTEIASDAASGANTTGSVPTALSSSLTGAGFTDNGDGSFSMGGVNYTYDASSNTLNGDDGSSYDVTQ